MDKLGTIQVEETHYDKDEDDQDKKKQKQTRAYETTDINDVINYFGVEEKLYDDQEEQEVKKPAVDQNVEVVSKIEEELEKAVSSIYHLIHK